MITKKHIYSGGAKLSLVPSYLYDKLLAIFYKGAMKHCGKHVYIRPSSSDFKGLWNLSVGGLYEYPERFGFLLYRG